MRCGKYLNLFSHQNQHGLLRLTAIYLITPAYLAVMPKAILIAPMLGRQMRMPPQCNDVLYGSDRIKNSRH